MATLPSRLTRHLLPPSECFALLVAALELIPFGLAGLHNPAAFADGYGLPIENTVATPVASSKPTGASPAVAPLTREQDQITKKALVAAIAARNVQNGILLFTFGLVLRDRKSLGVAVMAGLVATVADTVIVRAYGVKEKMTGHCLGVFNCVAIGGSLLYWGKNDRLW